MENFFGTPEVSIRTRGVTTASKSADKVHKSPFKNATTDMETPKSRAKCPLREITNSQERSDANNAHRSKVGTPGLTMEWKTPPKLHIFDDSGAGESVTESPAPMHDAIRDVTCTPQHPTLSMTDLHESIEHETTWKIVDESTKTEPEAHSPEGKPDESIYARIMKEAVHTLHRTPPSQAKSRASGEGGGGLHLRGAVSPSLSPPSQIMETVAQLSTSLSLEVARREEAERRLHLFISGADSAPSPSSAGSNTSHDGDDEDAAGEEKLKWQLASTPGAHAKEVSALRERLRTQELLADLLLQRVGATEAMQAYEEAGVHEGGEGGRLAGSLRPIDENGRESEGGEGRGVEVAVRLAEEVRRLRDALEEAEAEAGEREEEGRRALEEVEEEGARREAEMREREAALVAEKQEAEGRLRGLERVEAAVRGLEAAGKGALLKAAVADLEQMEEEEEEEEEESAGEEGGGGSDGYSRWEALDGGCVLASGLSPEVRRRGMGGREVVGQRRREGGGGEWGVRLLVLLLGALLALGAQVWVQAPAYRLPLIV